MRKTNLILRIFFFIILVLGISVLLVATTIHRISNNKKTDLSSLQATPTPESSTPPPAGISHEEPPTIAGAYLLNGDKLYGFRTEKRWPIASITKLMTALVTEKFMSMNDEVVINKEDVATEGEAPGFKPGEEYKIGDLMKALLLVSSNDAAAALARHYGEEDFVVKMNQIVGEVGMANTSFADPTGLSVQNLSTVEDLEKLVSFIWNNYPEIFSTTRLPRAAIVDHSGGGVRKLENINLFAGRADFLGGKTGYVPEADGNLVSIFYLRDKNSPVIIIVLGAEDRFQETEKILSKL